jgi:arylsulfatase
MSDNGAAAEDFYYNDTYGPFIREHFTDEYELMGQPNSFISYGPQWAEAGSSPFRYFKGLTTEGGMNTPMILSGAGVEKENLIHHGFVTLLDIAPTFYEVAKTEYPDSFNENTLYPLKGNSIMHLASGIVDEVHTQDYVFGLEHGNYAMLRKGDWKITNITRPLDTANFELYNLADDLAELNNLKDSEPEKFEELLQEWAKFSNEIKVQVPTPSGIR